MRDVRFSSRRFGAILPGIEGCDPPCRAFAENLVDGGMLSPRKRHARFAEVPRRTAGASTTDRYEKANQQVGSMTGQMQVLGRSQQVRTRHAGVSEIPAFKTGNQWRIKWVRAQPVHRRTVGR
jgi:hypothetical protein